jgi:acetyl esterase/lipase
MFRYKYFEFFFVMILFLIKAGDNTAQTINSTQIGGCVIPEGVKVLPDIAYRSGDSQAWRLDLAMPTELGEKPRPAIVFVHGGGWDSGDKRKTKFLKLALEYATKGYVSTTVEYRLVDEAKFPACINDVKCAVRWIRAHAEKYNVDPERIGAFGNSAGAHLVAMLGLCPPAAGLEGDGPLQEYSSMVEAVVCSATPTDLLSIVNNRFNKRKSNVSNNQKRSRMNRFHGTKVEQKEMRKKCSPITYVSANAPSFLIIHETSDESVSVKQSDTFYKALKEAGAKDITFMRFDEGLGHGVFWEIIEETGPAMEKFFQRTLK